MPSFSNIANRTGSLFGAIALLGALSASGARAEDFERTVPVEPGGTLRIEISTGSIDVETHDLSEVEIDARTSGWASRAMGFELEHEDDEVRLIALGKIDKKHVLRQFATAGSVNRPELRRDRQLPR